MAIGVAAAVAVVALRPRPRNPHIVFMICLDAVRPDHLGCYGHPGNTSPRIDALAEDGARFADAVTQAPWTLPSIATVLSSTFPCQHSARRTEGTQIAYKGLAHNFVETLYSMGFQTSLFTGGLTIETKVPPEELSGAALDWLKPRLDERCLVVIHHYYTHGPYTADARSIERLDPGYNGRFKYRFGDFEMLKQARVGRLADVVRLSDRELEHVKDLYDCQIMRADASVGMIVDSLRAWNRLDESMIIVFADHGEEFLEHGSIDHGQTVYEETIKVPLVVYCPAFISKPAVVERQVGLIDLAPTILDALGIQKPSYFEGLSLMPLVSDRFEAPREPRRPCGLPASCLITESIARRNEKKSLRRPPWKLIYDPFFGAAELYNISSDPHERSNLAASRPGKVEELTDSLLVMQKFYPGGWCVAWREPAQGPVRGKVNVQAALLEALAHNFFPEIDVETDSLVVSPDWHTVRFGTPGGTGWQGVEIRMAARGDVELDLTLDGRRPARTRVGYSAAETGFPLHVTPAEAAVDRKDLQTLFSDPATECVVFWIEPGSAPTAKTKAQAELRKQLKAIGYIE
jgi:hypothetical protein